MPSGIRPVVDSPTSEGNAINELRMEDQKSGEANGICKLFDRGYYFENEITLLAVPLPKDSEADTRMPQGTTATFVSYLIPDPSGGFLLCAYPGKALDTLLFPPWGDPPRRSILKNHWPYLETMLPAQPRVPDQEGLFLFTDPADDTTKHLALRRTASEAELDDIGNAYATVLEGCLPALKLQEEFQPALTAAAGDWISQDLMPKTKLDQFMESSNEILELAHVAIEAMRMFSG